MTVAKKVSRETLHRRAELFRKRVSGEDVWVTSEKISFAWKAGYATALRDHKPRGRK